MNHYKITIIYFNCSTLLLKKNIYKNLNIPIWSFKTVTLYIFFSIINLNLTFFLLYIIYIYIYIKKYSYFFSFYTNHKQWDMPIEKEDRGIYLCVMIWKKSCNSFVSWTSFRLYVYFDLMRCKKIYNNKNNKIVFLSHVIFARERERKKINE